VKIEIEVSDEIVSNLLCSAFEGGSNYWLASTESCIPEGAKIDGDGHVYRHDVPLLEGGMLVVHIQEEIKHGLGTRYTLTRSDLVRGLGIMRDKAPKHFGDALAENGDATTGDVFLQMCLFGEEVFG
jgi:hypothetical protein